MVEKAWQNPYYQELDRPWNEAVKAALHKVDRGDFVPDREEAYIDKPVSIQYGQWCSEPSCVAFIDDILLLSKGLKVLEIGTGCGYHAAVTSHLIGRKGHLYTIEFIADLEKIGTKNLMNHFGGELDDRITIITGDGSIGLPEQAPFDRIYLTAGVILKNFDPKILVAQLNPELGILFYPKMVG